MSNRRIGDVRSEVGPWAVIGAQAARARSYMDSPERGEAEWTLSRSVQSVLSSKTGEKMEGASVRRASRAAPCVSVKKLWNIPGMKNSEKRQNTGSSGTFQFHGKLGQGTGGQVGLGKGQLKDRNTAFRRKTKNGPRCSARFTLELRRHRLKQAACGDLSQSCWVVVLVFG